MLIDKDTGRVYDMRNETHLQKIQENQVKIGDLKDSSEPSSSSGKAWSSWYKTKRAHNQDLLWAAEYGNLDEVRRLLDKSVLSELVADVNTRGLDQWTALHFAANEGHLEVARELLRHAEVEREAGSTIQRTPLHLASIRGHTGIVRLLLAAGCDKNCKDFDENTPLHCASEFGHFECIIFLIKEAGADPSIKNKFGYSPSDIAQNF